MKYFLPLIFFSILTWSCKKPNQDSNEALEEYFFDSEEDACLYRKSLKELVNTYPFNGSDSVILISYPEVSMEKINIDTNPITDNKLSYDSIKEKIKLSPSQVDSLFSILYNFKNNRDGSIGMCYSPKHSIVFYNKKEPIEVLELCFECLRYKVTNKTDFGAFCESKFCLLENYFKWVGIEYGLEQSACE